MSLRTSLPFGPQHPVLPEPLHFDLVLENEKVVDAIPQIGYVHRGLEFVVTKRDYMDYVFVAERICGICSFMHGMGYCEGVERIMGVEIPDRAKWLRTFWCELSRIHSHLLWLGLAADAFGFENLFMASWRMRELVLDVIEETTGARVIFGSAAPGGVRRDVSDEKLAECVAVLDKAEPELRRLVESFLDDATVRHRLCGVGKLSAKEAYELGAVGPMLRASGIGYDSRQLGYAAYDRIAIEPIIEHDGDCWARAAVRAREIFLSLDILRQVKKDIAPGETLVKVAGAPKGETFVRIEQPRGEVVYYLRGDGTRNLERFRVRTPTYANIPAMIGIMKGSDLADVPSIVLTIDPCISCAER